jgi:hypothetical protein
MRISFKHSCYALAALLLSCCQAHATSEEKFWKWFEKNEDTLFNFESAQEATFDRLATEMHKLNPN